MEGSVPCSIAGTWRTVQMKWPGVKGDRTEQHREVVPEELEDKENRDGKLVMEGEKSDKK